VRTQRLRALAVRQFAFARFAACWFALWLRRSALGVTRDLADEFFELTVILGPLFDFGNPFPGHIERARRPAL